MGFLQFIRATSKSIANITGTSLGASAALTTSTATTAANTFKSIMGATTSAGMGAAKFVSAAAAKSMSTFLKLANILKKLAVRLVVLDAVFTLWYGYAGEGDENKLAQSVAVVFGKIIGGYGGAWIMGGLLTIIGTMMGTAVAGPIGGAIGFLITIIGAGFAGYYGSIIGEMFGLAVYKAFSTNFQDLSGFEKIKNYILKDIKAAAESGIKVAGDVLKCNF